MKCDFYEKIYNKKSLNMRHLGISGGSTKIAGLTGAAFELLEKYNYRPDVISGVSAGSILALPMVLGKWDMLEKTVKHIKLSDFFDIAPVNEKGKFTFKALLRVIFGKSSLGRQKNLVKKIKEFVSAEEFLNYQHNVKYPIIYIGTVDFKTGSRCYFNLKDKTITYAKFLQIILASSSIPIFAEPVYLNHDNKDMILFDGGVRDHIGTGYVLENVKGITETISIYSRPENYVTDNDWKDKNVLNVLERYVDITNIEVSKSDEKFEDMICLEQNIKQRKIFLPKILTSLYDVDETRLAMLYNAGREAAANAMIN